VYEVSGRNAMHHAELINGCWSVWSPFESEGDCYSDTDWYADGDDAPLLQVILDLEP
jgi:hypothetical protein